MLSVYILLGYQVFSDTTGVLFGSYIEALATRLGLPVPELTTAQVSSQLYPVFDVIPHSFFEPMSYRIGVK